MKRNLSLFLFFLLGIFAWWSITSENIDTEQNIASKNKNQIELVMNDFEIKQYDQNGKVRYTINGDKLTKFKRPNKTVIKAPVVNLPQNDKWEINARNAHINHNKEIVTLQGNVIMQEIAPINALTIRSQKMKLDMRKETVQTNKNVKVTQGESVITAKGMLYTQNNRELTLKNNIIGEIIHKRSQ